MLFRFLASAVVFAGALTAADAQAESHARTAMDEFMAAFNGRDVRAWAGTLNYPHVRFASNEVRVYNTVADFTLYIVTLKNGHWGVQGRSSYAP